MPKIPNMPQSLLDEHMRWHMYPGQPQKGGRAINPWPPGAKNPAPGSGLEFLTFHRKFLAQFHAWYDKQAFADPAAVAPWPAIPPELKISSTGWNGTLVGDEDRIVNKPSSFASADDLGRFVEWSVHGWLHNAAAKVYHEPDLANLMSATDSTHFYQIHGLIDGWWSKWKKAAKPASPSSGKTGKGKAGKKKPAKKKKD
jgi:hypothetical protein